LTDETTQAVYPILVFVTPQYQHRPVSLCDGVRSGLIPRRDGNLLIPTVITRRVLGDGVHRNGQIALKRLHHDVILARGWQACSDESDEILQQCQI